jgi:hypothetical protein
MNSTASARARTSGRRTRFIDAHDFVASGIVAQPQCIGGKFRNRRGIADTQIQALCADRRQNMSRFANKRDAAAGKRPGNLDGKRKHAPRAVDLHAAGNGMRSPFHLGCETSVIEFVHRPLACAGSSTQTRLERIPGKGTSVNGPVSV